MATKAIEFSNNWKKQGLYFLGDENNKNEIVITKNDTSYIRGNMLYFKYKDIDIYTDLDNAIYINTKNDTIQIMKYKELSPPEQREYVLLLEYHNNDLSNVFQGIIGRQETFDYIKSIIEEIDIEKSIILTETVQLKDALNIYEFMKECILNGTVINDDGFDIEEYNVTIDDDNYI